MYIDNYAEFCDATAITVTTTNALIGDVIDLGAAPTTRNLGSGEQVYLVLTIDDAVTSGGSATVTFTLLSDSTANLATSATTHWTSGAIAKATLVAGYKFCVPLPHGNYERYLGLFAATGTAELTGGTCSASLVLDAPYWVALPDAL